MPPVRTPLVIGNWKMNLDRAGAAALARDVASQPHDVGVGICPPFVYLDAVRDALGPASPGGVMLGAQDAAAEESGAFTGDVSVAMLKDFECTLVLAGHSERRHVRGETDEMTGAKCAAATAGGLMCVLCIGETIDQRQRGQTDAVNARQLRAGLAGLEQIDPARIVIAYEPVWAIGTGNTATPDDAQAAHAAIRSELEQIAGADAAAATRILYGGSVKPANAQDLLSQPDIDGGLIGGASLAADSFLAIVRAARAG